MADGMRSGEHSGIMVKNRNSSGCLIVKKKSDEPGGIRSSGNRKVFRSKKEKKRPRKVKSDSESSDEFLMPPRRRVGPETIQARNGLAVYEKGLVEESETGRKRTREKHIRRSEDGFIGRSDSGSSDEFLKAARGRVGPETGRKRTREEHIRHNEDGFIGRNGVNCSENKRNRLDVFEFNEYDGVDEAIFNRKKNFDYSGDEVGNRMLLGSRPMGRSSIEREYESGSSRHIFHEKKKTLYFDKSSSLTRGHGDRSGFGMDMDDNRLPLCSMRQRLMSDSDESIRVQGKNGVLKVMVNKKKKVGEPVKNFDHLEGEEAQRGSKIGRNLQVHPSFFSEKEVLGKPGSRTMKKQKKALKSPPIKKNKDSDSDSESEDGDTSLKLTPNNMEASSSRKRVSSKEEKALGAQPLLAQIKEGKVRRGCGTEKQKLRERIRGMLLDAGWTIDYRPRRNRDYQDAVYVNPTGTAYWSIIKAYDALLKQLNDEEDEGKNGDGSVFTPLPDELLGQLTRKTKKKEKEMKRKQRDGTGAENSKQASSRRSSSMRNEEDSGDSMSHEEKLSSFLKQGKSFKNRTNENGASSASSKSQNSILHVRDSTDRPLSMSNPRLVQGRKSRKFGRCTLLVRGSNQEQNAENDGFVPYSGKRTVLSWLIESGTVELSQKVKYMNRRCTKVMLQGWINRDGIHCGCCSKILTVSKFEIHAGSKLRQPFQNIYLDSGSSLLQCQIDAWDRQEGSEQIAFHPVDTDGDDPNDDTCGICGDGGDLICCDGCPSTFHQSCLNIELLPPGDWHCPNCICKFCGLGSSIAEGVDATDDKLLTCSMCEKKYHKSCTIETDALPDDSYGLVHSFCEKNCRELSEQLQKYIGVKHELESGFSWSLIRRTDVDPDTSLQGLPQRVECNSKLAVALTVMDECFLPIIDRRSGINLIHNVLYNSGSNFNRLNYHGFYTAILERGDEIISAASIRFHGTKLAEMPFIGTRHIYRHQGMFRRLLRAIESALYSLKVEKLVIPAIAELTHTWTAVFGFTPVEQSIKQEMRSLNMLVFPGIDMLQKLLLEQEKTEGSKPVEIKCQITPEVAHKSENNSSVRHNSSQRADGGPQQTSMIRGEVAIAGTDSQFPNVSKNDASIITGSLDSSLEPNCTVLVEGTGHANSLGGEENDESSPELNFQVHSIPDTSLATSEMDSKPVQNSSAEDNTQSCAECHMDGKPGVESPFEEGNALSKGGYMAANPGVDVKVAASSDEFKIKVVVEDKNGTYSEEDQARPPKEYDMNDADAVHGDLAVSGHEDLALSSENDIPVSVQGTIHAQSCKEIDMSDDHAVDEDVNNGHAIHARSKKESKENETVAASNEIEIPVSIEGSTHASAEAGEKLENDAPVAHDTVAASNEIEILISMEGSIHAGAEAEAGVSTSDRESPILSGASYDEVEMENKMVLNPHMVDFSHSCEEDNSLMETIPETKC